MEKMNVVRKKKFEGSRGDIVALNDIGSFLVGYGSDWYKKIAEDKYEILCDVRITTTIEKKKV